MKKQNSIRDLLIAAGVRNLKEFGYPTCNAENILTVPVYAAFFTNMLEEHLGKGHDEQVKALLKEMNKKKTKQKIT